MTHDSEDTNEALRLEARLARLEAQLLTHAEQLDGLVEGERVRKQRALLLRLVILLVMLGALFYLKARSS